MMLYELNIAFGSFTFFKKGNEKNVLIFEENASKNQYMKCCTLF